MYTQSDLTAIQAQQKKRRVLLGIPAVLLLVGIIVSFVLRVEWVTTSLTILLGILLIAGYDLLLKPLHDYEVHLQNVLHGRTHPLSCIFDRFSMEVSVVEGVRYFSLIVMDRDDRGRPYERLFYFDCEKPLPALEKGDRVHVVYHDKELADIVRA